MIQDLDIELSDVGDRIRLYLCHPSNRETIAELKNVTDRSLEQLYIGANELKFSIPFYISDDAGQQKKNPLFDLVRGHYLVRYEKDSEKEYYIIGNPKIS